MATNSKRTSKTALTACDDEPPSKRRKITQFFGKEVNKSKLSSNSNSNADPQVKSKAIFILAHGAGTTSQHPNIENWKKRLKNISKNVDVVTFDFKRPFVMAKLVATFQSVIDDTIDKFGENCTIILIGCSMGSRAAVNLASINGLPSYVFHKIIPNMCFH